jgi:DNA repair protein RAD51
MIRTGIKKLDSILGGGIRNGLITDIFGEAGTGKTQLAMQISINALVQGGKILFHDTTGAFRPERMLEMIESDNNDSNLLNNVKVARITNVAEQKKYLTKLNEKNNFSLFVIDNVTDLFSFEYSKGNQPLERDKSLMEYIHSLSAIAIENKIPIIMTNGITSFDNIDKEIFYRSIDIFTQIKIKLSKNDSGYISTVTSAFEENNFPYTITSKGLRSLS